jgi:hypothetical protein
MFSLNAQQIHTSFNLFKASYTITTVLALLFMNVAPQKSSNTVLDEYIVF